GSEPVLQRRLDPPSLRRAADEGLPRLERGLERPAPGERGLVGDYRTGHLLPGGLHPAPRPVRPTRLTPSPGTPPVPEPQELVDPPVEGGRLGGDIMAMGIRGSRPIAIAKAVAGDPPGGTGAFATAVPVVVDPPDVTGPLPVVVAIMGGMTAVMGIIGPLP